MRKRARTAGKYYEKELLKKKSWIERGGEGCNRNGGKEGMGQRTKERENARTKRGERE